MKRIIFTLLFILGMIKSNAQITSPFPDTSASWTIHADYFSPDPPSFPHIYYHNRCSMIKDTLIDTLTYHIINNYENVLDTTFENFWLYRIDSLKVYFRENNGVEYLRYDFGLQVGDSMLSYNDNQYMVLDSIDTFTIYSGQTLTRYLFSCQYCFYFSDEIVYYGIGSIHSPFIWQSSFANLSSFYYKNECYIFDIGQNYDSTLCSSANLANLEEDEVENSFSIYPNPSNGNFYIKMENHQNSNYEILDFNGNIITSSKINSGTTEINLAERTGIYILRIINENRVSTGKIVLTE